MSFDIFGDTPAIHIWHHCLYILNSFFTAELVMMIIGNIYVITAIAVIGGGLFGFDIASMSAM